MPDTVIEVRNLCKSFFIKHEEAGNTDGSSIRELFSVKNIKRAAIGNRTKQDYKAGYEMLQALDNVNFTIEQGDKIGIVGANGAGKSTLLKILSRITEPSSGEVIVKGRVVSLLEVGTGFHPELTGRENIFLNGIILGMKRNEVKKKFNDIATFSGVERFLDVPVKKYSSGMYMRLAFAVAVHMEPEILIIDEMLAVGDAQFQKKCIKKIEELGKDKSRTIIFVSHNIDAVRFLCNKAIFLDKGRLVEFGDINEVSEGYIASYAPQSGFTPNASQEIYFNDIQLTESEIGFDTELSIELEIISRADFGHYIIGLGISNSGDRRLSSALIKSKEELKKGVNIIRIKLPTKNLVPGNYKLSFALASPDLTVIKDKVEDYPTFKIITDQKHEELFSKWQPVWGDNVLKGSIV